ncbi:MAG: Arc family DNA-binding protein [Romboutsia sp.]
MEQFTMRLSKELMDTIRAEAKEQNRSINFILNELVIKGLNKRG